MSTTLSLYWNLASPATEERLDASLKLVSALESFQQAHMAETSGHDEKEDATDDLDVLNAQDVAYALRRLVRGLSSPRESSRLGFAVALTELLSRIYTVSASQIIDLTLSSAELTGSLTGQEERDMMFSRLFGFTSIIESGLIIRETALSHSSTAISSLQDYQRLVDELIALGGRKSWIRESCWWSILRSISALDHSSASFKAAGLQWIFRTIFVDSTEWTPEKVGAWLQFQNIWSPMLPSPLKSLFKGKHVLATGNLPVLAKVLKEVEIEEEDAPKQPAGSWKPHPHFVWTTILDIYLSPEVGKLNQDISSFHDFFRVVVDESIFSSTASPERKYVGFQLVEKCLESAPSTVISHLFTRNFVRTWINQLSKQDRYLHKAALKLASAVHKVVRDNPSTGFPLVIQLLGPNGSRDFDRLSKTKTVETILSNMDVAQIAEYVQFLLLIFEDGNDGKSKSASESDQLWALEQCYSLIRSTIVPKDDSWVHLLLGFFIRHGYFVPKKSRKRTDVIKISESVQAACRSKLFSTLNDLSSQAVTQHHDAKTAKFNGRTSAGEYWVIHAVKSFRRLSKDKEICGIFDREEEANEVRANAWEIVKSLDGIQGDRYDAAQGAILFIGSSILLTYRPVVDDSEEDVIAALDKYVKNIVRLFNLSIGDTKARKVNGVDKVNAKDEESKPIDSIVDDLIGYLEKPDTFMRTIAPQVFAGICTLAETSTVELLLEQLQSRKLQENEYMETDGSDDDEEDEEYDSDESSGLQTGEGSGSQNESSPSEYSEEDDEQQGEVDPELRKRISEALGPIAAEGSDESGSDEGSEILLDDDQMMELDEKLAEVFRAQSIGSKTKLVAGLQREATHFKIRVLDLVDIYLRKCPSSQEIPHVLLPLIHVVMKASADEQQLIDKTNGIIRRRIDSLQLIPENVDLDQLEKDLEEVHNISQKASHQQISPTSLTSVIIYMSKVLANHGRVDTAANAYRRSLDDFMKRKGSKICHTFFADPIKRIPSVIWEIREELVNACASDYPINTFRQMQAIKWMDALLNQTLQVAANKPEQILSTMQHIREVAYDSLRSACRGKHPLTIAQAKHVVKVALQAMRITMRVDPSAMDRVWDPPALASVAEEIQVSQKFTKGGGLMAIVHQMTRKLGIEQTNGAPSSTKKRKANDEAKGTKATKKTKKA